MLKKHFSARFARGSYIFSLLKPTPGRELLLHPPAAAPAGSGPNSNTCSQEPSGCRTNGAALTGLSPRNLTDAVTARPAALNRLFFALGCASMAQRLGAARTKCCSAFLSKHVRTGSTCGCCTFSSPVTDERVVRGASVESKRPVLVRRYECVERS